jgi:hypothetical protein
MSNHQKAMKQTAKPQGEPKKKTPWKAATILCDAQLLLTVALEILVLLDHTLTRVPVGAEIVLADLSLVAALLMLGLSRHYALSIAKPKNTTVPKATAAATTVPEKGEEEAVSYSYFDITQFRHNIRPDPDIPPDD